MKTRSCLTSQVTQLKDFLHCTPRIWEMRSLELCWCQSAVTADFHTVILTHCTAGCVSIQMCCKYQPNFFRVTASIRYQYVDMRFMPISWDEQFSKPENQKKNTQRSRTSAEQHDVVSCINVMLITVCRGSVWSAVCYIKTRFNSTTNQLIVRLFM